MSIILVDLNNHFPYTSFLFSLVSAEEFLKGAVAKWQGKGLQNPHRTVRFRPAPPAVSPTILLLEVLLSLPADLVEIPPNGPIHQIFTIL